MKAFPELAGALREMLDRMDRSLRAGGYSGAPILMYLAGGLAVNYYCGTRYTEDVDASESGFISDPHPFLSTFFERIVNQRERRVVIVIKIDERVGSIAPPVPSLGASFCRRISPSLDIVCRDLAP